MLVSWPARAEWTLEIGGAVVHNFKTTLELTGPVTVKLQDADYETRPFQRPLYYAIRLARVPWEVELIHQKIYLKNPPEGIERFSVSHGYNLVFVNHQWTAKGLILRAGGGMVVGHPEAEIAGVAIEPGYQITGPAFQAAVQKRFRISHRFFLTLEGKATAGRAHFSLQGVKARVPNVALHGVFGVGIKLK